VSTAGRSPRRNWGASPGPERRSSSVGLSHRVVMALGVPEGDLGYFIPGTH
jgi:hypothetical protein